MGLTSQSIIATSHLSLGVQAKFRAAGKVYSLSRCVLSISLSTRCMLYLKLEGVENAFTPSPLTGEGRVRVMENNTLHCPILITFSPDPVEQALYDSLKHNGNDESNSQAW